MIEKSANDENLKINRKKNNIYNLFSDAAKLCHYKTLNARLHCLIRFLPLTGQNKTTTSMKKKRKILSKMPYKDTKRT